MWRKISGHIPFLKKRKDAPVDQAVVQRLQRIRDLYMESADIMAKTKSLTTFISRYDDARRFISGFNSLMVQVGQDPIPEMNDDIDGLFISRIGEVVAVEIESAQKLKTSAGRQDRLQRIINTLERVDRPDDGPMDDAIMEAEDQVFRVMSKDVDWSKEPESADLGVSEDFMMEALKEAVKKDGRRRGLSEAQIEEAWRKTFEK